MVAFRDMFWKALECGWIPDFVVRYKVRQRLTDLVTSLNEGGVEGQSQRSRKFLGEIEEMPIAINQTDANDQHYEIPAEFYQIVLGPQLKYSCGFWPEEATTLAESEEHMLRLYCQRAQVQNEMAILDLGCGWGSVGLYVAKNYPESQVTCVSNSQQQRQYILETAKTRSITNIQVFTGDVATFERDDFLEKFDRVMSIEMFEHMKNYRKLMKKIGNWLKPNGKMFVHIFTHRHMPYHFERGWMARTFFTGGTMPSHNLLLHFQEDLLFEDKWLINGLHYSKTLEAWLRRMDDNYEVVKGILDRTYGADLSGRWFANWRMFFLVCSETFAYDEGNEWSISLYLFKKRSNDGF